eukprot:3468375-Rhodomonas_salina.1
MKEIARKECAGEREDLERAADVESVEHALDRDDARRDQEVDRRSVVRLHLCPIQAGRIRSYRVKLQRTTTVDARSRGHQLKLSLTRWLSLCQLILSASLSFPRSSKYARSAKESTLAYALAKRKRNPSGQGGAERRRAHMHAVGLSARHTTFSAPCRRSGLNQHTTSFSLAQHIKSLCFLMSRTEKAVRTAAS